MNIPTIQQTTMTVSVVMPIYNERHTLRPVVEHVPSVGAPTRSQRKSCMAGRHRLCNKREAKQSASPVPTPEIRTNNQLEVKIVAPLAQSS